MNKSKNIDQNLIIKDQRTTDYVNCPSFKLLIQDVQHSLNNTWSIT